MSRRTIRAAVAATVAAGTLVAASAVPASAQIKDRRGVTRIVSLSSSGVQGNWHSGVLDVAPMEQRPAITPDARFVAFASQATNLHAADVNNTPDIYVRDRDADADGILDEAAASTTALVSLGNPTETAPLGAQGGTNIAPALSHGARHVAFVSMDGPDVRDPSTGALIAPGSRLLPDDTNGVLDVYVRDRDPDGNGVLDEPQQVRTVRVSLRADGTQYPGTEPRLVPSDPNDPDCRDPERVNTPDCPKVWRDAATFYASFAPSISADGRYVAFYSTAPLTADDTNMCGVADGFSQDACADAYRYDRDADGDGIFDEAGGTAIELVSVNDAGEAGNDHSGVDPAVFFFPLALAFQQAKPPPISADGRHVAFESLATNLVRGDTNGLWDVFARDMETGKTVRLSTSASGAQGYGDSTGPAMSADGRLVAFDSAANSFVAGDNNFAADIFLVDRDVSGSGTFDTPGNIAVSRTNLQSSGFALAGLKNPSISPNGRYVGFEGARDVYRHDRVTGRTVIASVSSDGVRAQDIPTVTDGRSMGIVIADNGWAAFASRAVTLADDTNMCARLGGQPPILNDPAQIVRDIIVDPAGAVARYGTQIVAEITANPIAATNKYLSQLSFMLGVQTRACADVFVRLPGVGYCLEAAATCPLDDKF